MESSAPRQRAIIQSGVPPPSTADAWRHDPRTWTILSLTTLGMIWFAAGIGDRSTQALVFWVLICVQVWVLVVLTHRVVRLLRPDDPTYRFWWTLRGASVLFAVGDSTQLGTVLAEPGTPEAAVGGPVQASLLAVGTGWLVLVMLRYPIRYATTHERARIWLDIATVVTAVVAFGWYFTVRSNSFEENGQLVPDLLTILQGPVVLMVAGFAVAKLIIAGDPPYCRVAGVFAGITAISAAVARGLAPALVDTAYVNVFFGISIIGPSLTLVAVLAHEHHLRSGAAPADTQHRRAYSVLPYLAIAATYLLLIVVLLRQDLDARVWGLLLGAIASTVLVVARQIVSFAENADLVDQLKLALVERDVLADALRQQAFHDSLTGLANRALLHDRLDAEITDARRRCRPVVVMLIDLDDFKPVNDAYGHSAGDLLLKEVGRRLRGVVGDGDTVARFGGDEFAVLLCARAPGTVPTIADQVIRLLQQPYHVSGNSVTIHASIGVAVDLDGSWDTEQLLHNADTAMYAAKRQGKASFTVRHSTVNST